LETLWIRQHVHTLQLKSTTNPEEPVIYTVGADQKRRSRNDGTTTTGYNWEAGFNVIEEEDSGGTLTDTFVQGPGRSVGPIVADVSGSDPGSGSYRYYFEDNVGSTRRLRDGSKASLGQYEYDPYGSDYSVSGAAVTHKFSGHVWDETTKLYFAPYRYYAPDVARWLGRDPLGMVNGLNIYAYVKENPVLFQDPLGLSIWDTLCNVGHGACVAACVLASARAEAALVEIVARIVSAGYQRCATGCATLFVEDPPALLACEAGCLWAAYKATMELMTLGTKAVAWGFDKCLDACDAVFPCKKPCGS
jgi:RHS repeat-associated protein